MAMYHHSRGVCWLSVFGLHSNPYLRICTAQSSCHNSLLSFHRDSRMGSVASATHPATFTSRGNREEDGLDTNSLDAQSHTTKTSPDPLLASTLHSLPHPSTRPHHPLSNSEPASTVPLNSSHSSAQTWLDQVSALTRGSTASQKASQCERQPDRLKRKRSSSSDPGEVTPSIPLTRKALEQHLALTMSTNSSTTVDVCLTIRSSECNTKLTTST